MRPDKLLRRIAGGSLANVSFAEFCALLEALGFRRDRMRGSHLLYFHEGVGERLTIQPGAGGDAKSYQLRQLLSLVEQYDLEVKGR